MILPFWQLWKKGRKKPVKWSQVFLSYLGSVVILVSFEAIMSWLDRWIYENVYNGGLDSRGPIEGGAKNIPCLIYLIYSLPFLYCQNKV